MALEVCKLIRMMLSLYHLYESKPSDTYGVVVGLVGHGSLTQKKSLRQPRGGSDQDYPQSGPEIQIICVR